MTRDELQRRTLGEVIAALRARASMSQADLARKLETTQSHISRVERGEATLEWMQLHYYAAALELGSTVSPAGRLLGILEAVDANACRIATQFYGVGTLPEHWWQHLRPQDAPHILGLGVSAVLGPVAEPASALE